MDKDIYYTGVGSRDTPESVLALMHETGAALAACGYILRSGGSTGADDAFEHGCISTNPEAMEIYLPWKNFNGKSGPHYFFEIHNSAFDIARILHENWSILSSGKRLMHARNVQQVLGASLTLPSSFLICYTDGGKRIGGTRTAIALAVRLKIPVLNLGNPQYTSYDILDIIKWVNKIKESQCKQNTN